MLCCVCLCTVMLCLSGGSVQRGLYTVWRCSPVNKSITDMCVSTYVMLPVTGDVHTVNPAIVITSDWVKGIAAAWCPF